MSTALKGCVIIEETARTLKYKYKCEKCGTIPPGSVNSTPVLRGSTRRSSFKCTKCGKMNEVVIRGN
jgi:predicted RNA-binding Zn-ribbon protein involved in translation (DUF1610 family)